MTGRNTTPGLPAIHESWLPRSHPLHRPHPGGRQRMAMICAIVFFTLQALLSGVGVRASEIENHRLADFPALDRGWAFFTDLNMWATDNLVFRKAAIDTQDWISRTFFGEPPQLGGGSQGIGANPLAGGQRSGSDQLYPRVIEGKDNWMYDGDDVRLRCTKTRSLDQTITQLRRLRAGVERSGRKFVLAIAPDKSTIVPQYLPDDYAGKDCATKATEQMWQRLPKETGALDLRAELKQMSTEMDQPVYPPQDGHWKDEGGLLLAKRLAEAVKPGITATWKSEVTGGWTAPADLAPLIGKKGTDAGLVYSLAPDGVRNQAADEPRDFRTELHLDSATGTGTVREPVGMLSDSFTTKALRYLKGSFGDLTIQHYGNMGPGNAKDYARQLGSNKVIVVEVVERTIASGSSVLLDPKTVDGFVSELLAHPIR
ncbi:hypothetical protein D5S17_21695 [Pseudonocardiaceae bacterium YIM PH 21723]|nr:hypothetical protein D5S17_21695 [Pseudonocardiaceae bacterium YIM PH 21723]